MALNINNQQVKKLNFKGQPVNKGYINGQLFFSSGGTLVASDSEHGVITSDDGVTWTTKLAGVYGSIFCSKSFDRQFLISSDSTKIYTSSDTENWSLSYTLPLGKYIASACLSDEAGMFVCLISDSNNVSSMETLYTNISTVSWNMSNLWSFDNSFGNGAVCLTYGKFGSNKCWSFTKSGGESSLLGSSSGIFTSTNLASGFSKVLDTFLGTISAYFYDKTRSRYILVQNSTQEDYSGVFYVNDSSPNSLNKLFPIEPGLRATKFVPFIWFDNDTGLIEDTDSKASYLSSGLTTTYTTNINLNTALPVKGNTLYNNLFLAGNYPSSDGLESIIYSSNGTSWTKVTGIPDTKPKSFIVLEDKIVVQTLDKGIYYSSDGINWNPSNITSGTALESLGVAFGEMKTVTMDITGD